MKKEDVKQLIENGHILERSIRPDLGTSSLSRPIKRNGRDISVFTINGQKIHSSVGYSIIRCLKQIETKRSGICTIIKYSKNVTGV